jgi:hypothetical protein
LLRGVYTRLDLLDEVVDGVGEINREAHQNGHGYDRGLTRLPKFDR